MQKKKNLGLETIITDHHFALDRKRKKKNPKHACGKSKTRDDKYPDDMLCGSGVVFKIICGVLKSMEKSSMCKKGMGEMALIWSVLNSC